jgi:NADPH-dependent ferric siderophore reductase
VSDPTANEPWRQRYRHMRVLEVLRVRRVTPLMHRVTLGGDEIRGIPEGPNLKLVIPPRGTPNPVWPIHGPDRKLAMPAGLPPPTTRTYSLRRLDRAAGELDVDFVMHGKGIASTWASEAQPGDKIGIGGPGGPEVRPAEWYLLAGDHTALPAISRILEQLPPDARGEAVVEVPDRLEQQNIERPAGVNLTWVHSNGTDALETTVREMPWPTAQKIYAWLAAESSAVRSLRSYVRDEKRLGRGEFLAIGYWRRGMSEPEYHDKLDHDRGEDFYDAIRDEEQHRHEDHSH